MKRWLGLDARKATFSLFIVIGRRSMSQFYLFLVFHFFPFLLLGCCQQDGEELEPLPGGH